MALSRIDTHHHLFPPEYLAAIEQRGVEAAGGGIAFPEWSSAVSLEMMDRYGIQHIVFGSDFPYVHGNVLDFEIKELDQLDVFDADARQAITRTNALSLFPRFQLPRHCS
jgi:predicted TIM-barrel fold metal-dependent hydrolase